MDATRRLYLFTLEVVPLKVGGIYDMLPSHCTLVSRFWLSMSPDELADTVRPIFEQTSPVLLTFGDTDTFGPPPVTVNKIERTKELNSLHTQLCSALGAVGAEYLAPHFVGDGWRPHVTERESVHFTPGQQHLSEAAYLIQVKVPGREHARFIRAKFDLPDD